MTTETTVLEFKKGQECCATLQDGQECEESVKPTASLPPAGPGSAVACQECVSLLSLLLAVVLLSWGAARWWASDCAASRSRQVCHAVWCGGSQSGVGVADTTLVFDVVAGTAPSTGGELLVWRRAVCVQLFSEYVCFVRLVSRRQCDGTMWRDVCSFLP
ncbi:hypothetical protein E2C01_062358 [Portunus trituberculatus]|uniref:Uncharacterized protein n=1 Tax=Portunus trituberculatus TaxID=210409 RepID=A0A5B7H680_PORTR|nr:hypothetical protein [Portunus trituberculatus]